LAFKSLANSRVTSAQVPEDDVKPPNKMAAQLAMGPVTRKRKK